MARRADDLPAPVDDVVVDEAADVPEERRSTRRGRPLRSGPGPRAQARRQARRRRLRGGVLWVLAAAAVGVLVVVAGPVLLGLVDDARQEQAPAADGEAPEDVTGDAAPAPVADAGRRTVLLTTTDPTGDDAGALGAMVLGVDADADRGTVLLVPTTLAADVPGYGLLQLARAEEFGAAPLVALTLENLTGIRLDQAVTVAQQDWAAVFSRVGGFEVEVRERLVVATDDGGSEARFEPGTQFLDGPRLAELLTLRQPGEPELAMLPRIETVLEGFLAAAADGGIDAVFSDGAPMLDATDTEGLESVLRALVDLQSRDALDVRTLPVTPLGAGDDASYRLDAAGTAALVADRFPGAADGGAAEQGVRLEIRNGNGVPGIGARVAELLVPLGHRVVLTGNADTFDHPTTRVIIYDDDATVVTAAQEILEVLGTGRLEVSEVPQGITDVTVLVGQDFTG